MYSFTRVVLVELVGNLIAILCAQRSFLPTFKSASIPSWEAEYKWSVKIILRYSYCIKDYSTVALRVRDSATPGIKIDKSPFLPRPRKPARVPNMLCPPSRPENVPRAWLGGQFCNLGNQ